MGGGAAMLALVLLFAPLGQTAQPPVITPTANADAENALGR
jgi:hypothetical protein